MDGKLVDPDTDGFRVVEKDPQFTENKCRIFRVDGENDDSISNYLKIASDAVSCTGRRDSLETKFKVHVYQKSDVQYALFECIGGKNTNWMLCVKSNQLSARKRTKEYINFEDAEEDVKFSVVRPRKDHDEIQIKWEKGGQFIGFDAKGQPLMLDKVNKKELFRAHPIS